MSSNISADIESVKSIPIVPTMLEVICRTTGMGFAAIARVTQDRWIACSVRDEIAFGLEPGGELQIETTICNEIRDSRNAVIIDHVAGDEAFSNHHTPKMYGFQSYISVPIILKNGEFFGTLCAIDPRPAQLKNPRVIGMFNLFSELISFHLHSIDQMERNDVAIRELNRQLSETQDENRQYRHISNHNLQEPLRKIRLFSNMLVDAVEQAHVEKSKELALKVNAGAQRISMMIKDLSDFSELNYVDASFEKIDLNKVVADVCAQLEQSLFVKGGRVIADSLPYMQAISMQMEQLFYHLISNALKFARTDAPAEIRILVSEPDIHQVRSLLPAAGNKKYVRIRVQDNGMGIEKQQLEKIFDIFARISFESTYEGFGLGLAYCRKIIRNHGGFITAESTPGVGTAFTMILPLERTVPNS
ncbi:sensor histidine kinase [Chitinophaga pinensis]|uniref:histidine kinase n=1 Tax=Chitinophaga pinensis (strain ATCC 43595 / DSM 2588 / LMG 13176 / NBRC 15968 / NCIMB 11800 / UQM 2034) TaxID=485918 RepID=A0A979GV33_CHIPD|nr:ATP-binding protein [Chitinophaga pinensis]ACU63168.1 GAF sensor signal transduction histidine kinase [Chitinophaga pinensis DSM 2588]